jgi:hypothetical protein
VVASSTSWDNTYEIAEFTPSVAGNYSVRVRKYSRPPSGRGLSRYTQHRRQADIPGCVTFPTGTPGNAARSPPRREAQRSQVSAFFQAAENRWNSGVDLSMSMKTVLPGG